MIVPPTLDNFYNYSRPPVWSLDVKEDTPFHELERFILESLSRRWNGNRSMETDDGIRSETFILDVHEDTSPGELEQFIRETVDANQEPPEDGEADIHTQRELVLVVEDHIPTQRLERLVLESEGHRVKVTNRGEDALRIITESSPSLILLDVGLPGKDGFTTCRRVREFSQIPIIMVTGRDSTDDQVKALHAGADDFLSKAFLSRELPARVQTLLELSRSRKHTTNTTDRVDEVADLEELYQGDIPVVAQVTGSMRRLVEFSGELRDRMDLRLLRFEAHGSRASILLALRVPLALKKVLLEMTSVERLGSRADQNVEAGQETILVYLLP